MPAGQAWANVANAAIQMGFAFASGNPLPVVTGAVSFVGWLYDVSQRAGQRESSSEKPTRGLSEQLSAITQARISGRPRLFSWPWGAGRATRRAIRRRASEIAESSERGSDFDNWVRAVAEVGIAERAAEIARSPQAGSDEANWLRAERELEVAERAREIARSPRGRGELDNWLLAEREVRIAKRAEEITASPEAGSDEDNWYRAERELDSEHELIAARAREIAASREAGSDEDNWLRAEDELRAAGQIRNW
jgi:hypothetical protein